MDRISDQVQHVSALPPMPDSIVKIQQISSDPPKKIMPMTMPLSFFRL